MAIISPSPTSALQAGPAICPTPERGGWQAAAPSQASKTVQDLQGAEGGSHGGEEENEEREDERSSKETIPPHPQMLLSCTLNSAGWATRTMYMLAGGRQPGACQNSRDGGHHDVVETLTVYVHIKKG